MTYTVVNTRRPTHRIIFTVADDVVLVLAVRHVAQDELQPDDLTCPGSISGWGQRPQFPPPGPLHGKNVD